ncbi:MAG: response regulator transcription factor [Lachnospiraceae bacterium]|jgi:DNA-binding NarL/FixJ family response regulator|nr:response regulator transcription factor [Lachnospiraceae bacterium]
MKLKIVLVDDHILVREGIKKLVEFDGSMEVIAEAGDGVKCLEILQTVYPDLLLLDINMPKMSGFDVLEELRAQNREIKVLMLTVHNEVEYILRSVDVGADGYILKDAAFSELKKAIEAVIAGETYIQPQLIPPLNSRMVRRSQDNERIAKLTKRETEILVLIAEGYYNKEIGKSLIISERTVKNHISSIFKKLEVADRTQAAVFAIKNNLVKL